MIKINFVQKMSTGLLKMYRQNKFTSHIFDKYLKTGFGIK